MNLKDLKNTTGNTPVLYHTLQVLGLLVVGALVTYSLLTFLSLKQSILNRPVHDLISPSADAIINGDTEAGIDAAAKEPDSFKILFVGDMMFDRGVRSVINNKGFEHAFGPATTTFDEHDVVIGNLEGTITNYPSKLVLPNNKAISGFQFTFSTATAPALKNAGIDIVSLANNHTHDFGQEGVNQTRTNLADADIQYFGSYTNSASISTTTCPRPDFCIGLIGWNEFGYANDEKIIEEIRTLRPQVQYLVVYPHWGVEYIAQPTMKQRTLAQNWIDSGADAVIGGHAHTVQRIEQYIAADGRIAPIFYSLGNFIFDQYFSFNTTHGIGLSITFEKSVSTETYIPTYSVIPFSSIGSHVSLPTEANKARLFKNIEDISASGTRDWLEFK